MGEILRGEGEREDFRGSEWVEVIKMVVVIVFWGDFGFLFCVICNFYTIL